MLDLKTLSSCTIKQHFSRSCALPNNETHFPIKKHIKKTPGQ